MTIHRPGRGRTPRPSRRGSAGSGVARALLLATAAALLVLGAAGEAGAQVGVGPSERAAVLLEAARSFEAEGAEEVARALYRRIVELYPSTPSAEEARERLAGLADGAGASGSVELQVWSTLYGLWLGVAVPAAFGADGPEPYGAGLLVGGPAGFLGGRALTRSREWSVGQARAVTLGGSWGTWQGFGWQKVLELGVEEVCSPGSGACFEEDDGEEVFASMVLGGLAGVAAGAVLARRPVPAATATGANLGSLWGTWFGVAAGVLVDLEDDDLLAAALLAGNAGLVGGALAAPRWGWSRNRWRLVSIAGVIGGLGGLGIDLLTQPDDDKVAVAIPLATSLLGLGIGVLGSRGADGGADGAGAPGGAVLNVRDGRLSLDLPLPHPVVRPVHGPGGTELRPALGVVLARAVF